MAENNECNYLQEHSPSLFESLPITPVYSPSPFAEQRGGAVTLSVQSSAGLFQSAQGYPAIHPPSPSGLIGVQLQLLPHQLYNLVKRSRETHEIKWSGFSSFVQEKKKGRRKRFFFRCNVEVIWKRSTTGSNNNILVNHYFHAPLGRNFFFFGL